MSSSSSSSWSLTRSLAFLAAIFALTMGALLPSAVAASAATGVPVMLCSGDQMTVVFDADGTPRPAKPTSADSLKCAGCILAAMTALPTPPDPTAVRPVIERRAVGRATAACSDPLPAKQKRRRPPPTAPPTS